jgi:hypothetical protein
MIAVELAGRLGNEMFIYAFALSAARRLRCPFVLLYDFDDPRVFQLPSFFECASFRPGINRFLARIHGRLKGLFPRQVWNSNDEPELHLAGLRRFATYFGYMQSEKYFSADVEVVRKEFAVQAQPRQAFADKYGDRLRRTPNVVLHCRRMDYREFGNPSLGYDLRLPLSYYDSCLREITDLEQRQVFVVGDDIGELEQAYGGKSNFHFERNDPITDFQLLASAEIAVLSNSSFSWWAGFLGRPGRTVFAPDKWLGFKAGYEYPRGICSMPWRWMNVPRENAR